MNVLRRLSNNIRKSNFFNKDFLGYTTLFLLGNTIPIWLLLVTDFIEKGMTCSVFIKSIHQPFTYLVLSGTLMSSTLYLWLKTVKRETESKNIPTLMLIYFFIALPLIGYLFIKTNNQTINEISLRLSIAVYTLFIVTLAIYLFYQQKDFVDLKIAAKVNSNTAGKVREQNDLIDLKDGLSKLDEDGER